MVADVAFHCRDTASFRATARATPAGLAAVELVAMAGAGFLHAARTPKPRGWRLR
jgi:hypothetical protein